MTTSPVTVIVPAYRPDRIVDTIGTLAQQDFKAFKVRIGYDHAPDYTPPDVSFDGLDIEIVKHPQRMGWVGNVNTLLASVDTPYFLILAHDDGLSPDFLGIAVRALEDNPCAVVAHGETEHRGTVRVGEIAKTGSICGTPFKRVLEFIRRGPHTAELGWRGLIRRAALPHKPQLRTRRSDGQFSNTLFALEQLIYGNSISIEGIRYIKNTGPTGLSRDLVGRPTNEKSVMLADNLACLAIALREAEDRFCLAESETILTEYALWLLSLQGTWNVLADERDSSRRRLRDVRPQVAGFVARALLSSLADESRSSGGRQALALRSSS